MLIFSFFLGIHVVLIGILVLEEFFVKKARNLFKAFFILIYYLTMVLVPFFMTLFFDGFRRINTTIQDQYFDLDVMFVLGFFQTILLVFFYINRLFKNRTIKPIKPYSDKEVSFHLKVFSLLSMIGLVIFLIAVDSDPMTLMSLGRFSWFQLWL